MAIRLARDHDCHLVGVAPTGLVDVLATPDAAATLDLAVSTIRSALMHLDATTSSVARLEFARNLALRHEATLSTCSSPRRCTDVAEIDDWVEVIARVVSEQDAFFRWAVA